MAGILAPSLLKRVFLSGAVSSRRNLSTAPNVLKRSVTLVPGDGIGSEMCAAVMGVFQAARVPVVWEVCKLQKHKSAREQVDEILISIARNQVCLKGPLHTAVDSKEPSRNFLLRESLNLFANVVPIKMLDGIKTRHKNVDFVVIRENTEGEYVGKEHEVVNGVVQSFKVITRKRSARIARYAFEYAKCHNRKKVTAIHKANIQKLSDGEFLASCRDIAKEYPTITYNEMIVDNTCMQLVMKPQQFDVMLTPNLYGTIVTNVGMGLVGGPGIVPGTNIGLRGDAVFETGGRHVGMDLERQDKVNPTGMLFSSILMLRHIGLESYAKVIERAVREVVADPRYLTYDHGGTCGTKAFTKAVIDRIPSVNSANEVCSEVQPERIVIGGSNY